MISIIPSVLAASLLLSLPSVSALDKRIVQVSPLLFTNATANATTSSLPASNSTSAPASNSTSTLDFGAGNVTIASENGTTTLPITSANVTSSNITINTEGNAGFIIPIYEAGEATTTLFTTSTAYDYQTKTKTETETAYTTQAVTSTAVRLTTSTVLETSTAYETKTDTKTKIKTITKTATTSAKATPTDPLAKVLSALGDTGVVNVLPTIYLTLVPTQGADGDWEYSLVTAPLATATPTFSSSSSHKAATSTTSSFPVRETSITKDTVPPTLTDSVAIAALLPTTTATYTYTLAGETVTIGAPSTSFVSLVAEESIITAAPKPSAHAEPSDVLSVEPSLSSGRAGRPSYLSSAAPPIASASDVLSGNLTVGNETVAFNGTAVVSNSTSFDLPFVSNSTSSSVLPSSSAAAGSA